MASQSGSKNEMQTAAEQAMAGAPWQTGGDNTAMESLTQSLVDALKDATESVNNLTTAQESQTASAGQGAGGLLESMAGAEGGLASTMSAITGGYTGGLTGGGFLLSPIIGGILDLFGAGGSSAPPPITTFTMPPPLDADAAGGQATGGQLVGADFGANGLPRAQTATQTSNVTVQVNAMDSRSFLDRSTDIASAVRQAILSSHALNDVIAEL